LVSAPPVTTGLGATGVTLALAELVAVSPVLDVALTVNVYGVALLNPVTVIGLVPVAVMLLGLEMAVYVTEPLPV
jgi:hypothetical protein